MRHYNQQGISLLYMNLPRLLPSPAHLSLATIPGKFEQEQKPLPRADVTKSSPSVDKLYDSEKSDNEDGCESGRFMSLTVKHTAEDECQQVAPPSHGCRGNQMCKHARELLQQSLSCMSQLHDNLSFLDSSFWVSSARITHNDDTRWPQHRCRTLPGLSDDIGGTDAEVTQNWWTDCCVEDMGSTVEMYSFKRSKETLTGILADVDSLEDLDKHLMNESLRVPVTEQHCDTRIRRETDEEVR